MTVEQAEDRLTYGSYLRVPELLELQTTLSETLVPDEMLFIIGQQAQELWFKQILFELQRIILLIDASRYVEAAALLERVNRILRLLGADTEVLETMPPEQFRAFRGVLKSASGFESEQFRELEVASGLRDEPHLRMVARLTDLAALLHRWPRSMHDVFCEALAASGTDPVDTLVGLYEDPSRRPDLYLLAEALSEYEVRFQEWRFHHLQLVERVIGDRSPGTGGSAGSSYLGHTLSFRFFPELWEARNRLNSTPNP